MRLLNLALSAVALSAHVSFAIPSSHGWNDDAPSQWDDDKSWDKSYQPKKWQDKPKEWNQKWQNKWDDKKGANKWDDKKGANKWEHPKNDRPKHQWEQPPKHQPKPWDMDDEDDDDEEWKPSPPKHNAPKPPPMDDDDDDNDWNPPPKHHNKPKNHHIEVGPNGRLAYDKANIKAQPGDTVTFRFNPKNHTVTQSSFSNPCEAINGFKSGFRFVKDASEMVTFKVDIKDTKPIWGYCGQKLPVPHCGEGMVFAINADDNGPNSFDAFLKNAKKTAKPPGQKPPPSNDKPTEHVIIVGVNGDLAYGKNNIQAAVGDTVTFEFKPKNHTVTQSSFKDPCKPLGDTTGKQGFKSGFRFISPDSKERNTFSFKINDTEPIWGYCGQKLPVPHCGQGMVFAINAVESGPNNFAAFLANAKKPVAPAGANGASSVKAISGAIEAGGDSGSSQSKELIRNSYILIGMLAAVVLGFIVLFGLLLGKGCIKGRPVKTSQYKKTGELEKLEESESFTHPDGKRYSD